MCTAYKNKRKKLKNNKFKNEDVTIHEENPYKKYMKKYMKKDKNVKEK